ncbi:hypothetical protein [Ligilactobacillus salivarius]|uniref:hypothetical protein n=1 Tax=Ligilactobacillus salivarius TaxID=1624 RepID=UPI00136869F4|nr:hypothetical protein [Ligilactobacillus salivarius]
MTYFWIRTIAGILVVVATISTSYYLKTGHAWIFIVVVISALIEIPLSYYQEKKKNK